MDRICKCIFEELECCIFFPKYVLLKSVFVRTNVSKSVSTEIHIFCLLEINGAENVNFCADRFWYVRSYKKQTLILKNPY